MLTEICQYLHNYFDRGQPRYHGEFIIENGVLQSEVFIEGQYIRIIGSRLNDGVWEYSTTDMGLKDETFDGTVWSMCVPPSVLDIAKDITAWQSKFGDTANTPFSSESFGGYSYSKSNSAEGGWQSAFATRLEPWRKL